MKTIRRKGWQQSGDGVPFIYKDPDTNVFYEPSIKIKGSSITSGPTWTSDGPVITNDTSSVTAGVLTMIIQVRGTGRATVIFTDNLGNEEAQTYEWKCRDR